MRNETPIRLCLAVGAAILAASCGPEAATAPAKDEQQKVAVSKQALLGIIPCTEATWGGHGYRFCFDIRTWDDSRDQCQRRGMDLVTINSAAENAFVLAQAPLGTWIGGNDLATEGHWVWASSGTHFWTGTSSGSPAPGQYANWKSSEPQNFFNEDVAIMEAGSGKWVDLSPLWLWGFSCETSDDQCPGNPSKMTPGQCGCAVNDTDSDGDGLANCLDECPNDSGVTEAGDCGCPSSAAPSGTTCDDGLCQLPATCNGAGVCGNPYACAPDTNCTYKRYDDRVYWFCTNARTWTDARDRCRTQVDVELASINDTYENQFVSKYISDWTWLGGNDRDSRNRWFWSDKPFDSGEQFWSGDVGGAATPGTFTSWLAGEPSAVFGEECLFINTDSDKRSRWMDGNCTFPLDFVCEQPADQCPDNGQKLLPGICGCNVADTDADGDGRPNCIDNCPNDPLRFEPGDCGCVGNAGNAAAGTSCDDGICSANTQCDGAGRCGTTAQCAPDTNCVASIKNRHVYWDCKNNRTWSDAANRCAAKTRTRLASMQTANENDFVTTQIVADAWIGGSDSAQEGKWKWTGSGTQLWDGGAAGDNTGGAFTAWALDEPNNWFNEDCLMLQKADTLWLDLACSGTRDWVCETCVPLSCAELGAQCGTIDDGCGGTLNCTTQTGGCGGSEVCFPAANRCSDADGSDCHEEVEPDPLLPPEEQRRDFFADHAACTSTEVDRCLAELFGDLREDSLQVTNACTGSRVGPAQHNTLNLDRNRKRRLAQTDSTYACRVKAGDNDHDLVPDDVDACPDTPPQTATFDDGCTNPALAPGPDEDHMDLIRDRQRVMHDEDCNGMSMSFVPDVYSFVSPPPENEATLHFGTVFPPSGCEVAVEVRADALLNDGTRGSYAFVFNLNESTISHAFEVSYVSFFPADPGDRGEIVNAEYQDLIYSIRFRNGNGAVTPWSEPEHASPQ